VRKEVLIAIIIGFGLGLVITFGIWTANKALREAAPKVTPAPEVTPTPTPAFSLTVTSPEDNALYAEETIEVSGATAPGAIIVILYQEGEKILEADSEGKFSTEITLAGGANEIKISAYDQEGNEAEKTLTVVYSTAEI
jgi:hypothetical protein